MNPPSEHKLGDQLCNLAHVGSERRVTKHKMSELF